MSIFDVSDQSEPEEIGLIHTYGNAMGVAISGDYAYIADGYDGLVIIDIKDKKDLQKVGGCDTSDFAQGVAISGEYAYVADWENGLVIIDIKDKTDPQKVGGCNTSGYANRVVISGDYAYIADTYNGLVIIDIKDKTDPQKVGRQSGDAFGVAISGDYAYIADDTNGLVIIDIKDKTDPKIVGESDTSGQAYGVVLSGDYAFIADYGNGLVIIDITDKTDPKIVGGYDTSGYANGVAISSDYAYIADEYNGLVIIDITDKTDPQRVGGYDTSGYANGVATSGDYLFIADEFNKLIIIAIKDKTYPERVGSYYTSGEAIGVAISGDYAYIADGNNGLVIIDIKDKTDPKKVGGHDISNSARGVTISGDYAYIADWGNGLVIIDIKDKTDPQKVGDYDTSGSAWGVATSGDYAYIADGNNGLVIIDIKDKTDPKKVGDYDTSSSARGVAISGDYAFIADYGNGLVIIDIKDKTDPQKVGDYDTSSYAIGIAISGDYAYVADDWNGLVIIDIKDKTDPQKVGGYDTSGRAYGVAISGDYAYIADYRNGMVIIEMILNNEKPTAIIDNILPNPANEGEKVYFYGNGSDDGTIEDYEWISSINGFLSYEKSFSLSNLSNGTHTIYFKVKDNNNTWSNEVSTIFTINGIPRAKIDEIKPNPSYESEIVYFYGNGTDDDGTIVEYRWDSNLDEFISSEKSFATSLLSVGEHEISFKVKDDSGTWSNADTETLIINEKENQKPTITIEKPEEGEEINGIYEIKGTAENKDGEIQKVEIKIDDGTWKLADGKESWNYNWDTLGYSIGEHIIYARAIDDYGNISQEAIVTVKNENKKPTAKIVSISPNPSVEEEIVRFEGHNVNNGNIVRYVWHSNIVGELYNGSNTSFNTSTLTPGEHTISFKIQNEDGIWSDEVSMTLLVNLGKPNWKNGDCWKWKYTWGKTGETEKVMIITETVVNTNANHNSQDCYELWVNFSSYGDRENGTIWLSKENFSLIAHDFTDMKPSGAFTFLPLFEFPFNMSKGNKYFSCSYHGIISVDENDFTCYKFSGKASEVEIIYSSDARHIVSLDSPSKEEGGYIRFEMEAAFDPDACKIDDDDGGDSIPGIIEPKWIYTAGGSVETVDITANGQYIIIGSADANITLFEKESGTPLWSYTTGDCVYAVAISNDGEYIAGGSYDNKVYLFQKESSTPLWDYYAGNSIEAVAISADGNYIVAGSRGGGLYLFHRDSSTPLWNYTANDNVKNVVISADGSFIIAATEDDWVYLFSRDNSTPLWSFDADLNLASIDISADGNYIVAGADKLYLFNRESSTPIWSFTPGEGDINSVDITPDGMYIAAGSGMDDNKVYLFKKDSDIPLREYQVGEHPIMPLVSEVNSVSITSNGEYIAAGANDLQLYLFHRNESTPIWTYKAINAIESVAISEDGNYIIAGEFSIYEAKVYFFDLETEKEEIKYDVKLSTNEKINVKPGDEYQIKFTIKNNGTTQVHISFRLEHDLEEWIFVTPEDVTMNINKTEEIIVSFSVPKNTKEGDYKLVIVATYKNNQTVLDELEVTIHVEKEKNNGGDSNNFIIIISIGGIAAIIGILVFVTYRKKSSEFETPQQPQFQTQQMQPQQIPAQPSPTQQTQNINFDQKQTCPFCNAQVPNQFKYCNMCGKQIKN